MEVLGTKPTVDIRRELKQCPTCSHRFSRDAGFCPFDGSRLEPAQYDPLGDPLLGTTIDGRYEVVALLGEGGMGQVYRVRHVQLDRLFAMKVLRKELARDAELCGRFIQEARATASVRHPNIVAITDFGQMPSGIPFFVMELLMGQSLADVVKAGGPAPVGRAVRIVEQIASALGAAHAAGIVHRDLKPDNVFLVGGMAGGVVSDDVRVVDFGAAKIVGSSRVTRQGVVFGTPAYMSPEQASGQPVDHRADVYALGVVLYEMLAGRVPFVADTYMGVLTQHMFVQPVPPSRVAQSGRELGALEEITLICLAKKPEERFATMEELASAIRRVVHMRGDGTAEIAPRSAVQEVGPSRGQGPARARFRMADELEPPTFEELRVGIDGLVVPRRVVPWGWLAGLGAALVCAAVAWVVARGVTHAAPAPSAVPAVDVGTTAPKPPSTALLTVPPPPPPAPGPGASLEPSRAEPEPAPSPASLGASRVLPPPALNRRVPAAATPKRTNLDDVGDPFAAKH
jgi:serine/threonine-protein kinase